MTAAEAEGIRSSSRRARGASSRGGRDAHDAGRRDILVTGRLTKLPGDHIDMPSWAVILGSGGLAGLLVALIAPIITDHLQQRRERERESREARAAWVARQRELCTGLLQAVVDFRRMLHTLRTLHDDLESRLAAKEMLEFPRQQMQSVHETVRRV